MKKLKVGSDFSGVGAFNQALIRLGVDYEEIFACDMDKYARQTFIHNYGEPNYFPMNVYERDIPSESLDIYMTSPPCQAFSLAGRRLGEGEERGILFYNSFEFVQKNKPRYFIFENVKGLLSSDKGATFNKWVSLLGGKSINGVGNLLPEEGSAPYHIYWKVLNAKKYGVPQNRERVFIVGIRDDEDNSFVWPSEEVLTKRLKDILEYEVEEKYFLTGKMLDWIGLHREKRDSQNNFPLSGEDVGSCITSRYYKMGAEDPYIKVKSATKRGYELAIDGDSINFSNPNSATRRGRVGRQVAQTLDTACNQGVVYGNKRLNQTIEKHGPFKDEVLMIDSYNQTIHEDSICISTRVSDSNSTHLWDGYAIRKLTPRECFRLMDFPDTFTWPVSDTQAYKQAGNSIVVNVLYKILKNLNL